MEHRSLKRQLILLVLLALFAASTPLSLSASTIETETSSEAQVTALPRLRVSADGHYFVTETGAPFFWLGDTAWEMFARLSREEVEQYLENRRTKGFNVIQVVILTEHSLNTPNFYGDIAISGNNPLRPNENYFKFVDWMIAKAAEKGLYVGLLPTWGDKVNIMNGKGPVIFNTDNARRYGDYVGKRYKNATNVIWILGGDRNVQSSTQLAIWKAMATGINTAAGASTMITYHPRGESSSAPTFNSDANFDFNMIQSGHNVHDFPLWNMITTAYNMKPTKPILDGEINYEASAVDLDPKKGYFDAYDVRKQAYRSVFAGGSGVTYGHHSIWQFYSPTRRGIASPIMYWYDALNQPGAAQLKHLATLMLSRPYFNRIPDQTLLASAGDTNATHMRATRASDGSYAFVYLPTNRSVTVNLTKLSGTTIRASWFDPQTGITQPIGEFAKGTQTSRTFTPPASLRDSVLILENAGQVVIPPPGDGKPTVKYRAINLNGPSIVLNGMTWEAGTNPDLRMVNARSFCNQNVALVPQVDAETAKMLRCSVYGNNMEVNVANVPNGTYEVALYVWEDNRTETFSIKVEGKLVTENYKSGAAGTWARFSYASVTVTDNQLKINTIGGHANLSGIEIKPSTVVAP
jgi:hypothetical protein